MRPVVIVLLDPAGDAAPRFFHAPILRRPNFLFLQAAMEPLDVAVAFRVMIGRAAMGDPQRVAAFACRVDEPANEPISAGTAKGKGGSSNDNSIPQEPLFGTESGFY